MQTIIDMLKSLLDFFLRIASSLIDRYMELNLFEKIIAVNSVAAFFAIILPVAQYYIFETWFMINNPLAVYMIGIVLVMFVTFIFFGRIKLGARVVLNLYYLFWVFYLHLSGNLSKAPYELKAGYYINIAVPVIYTAASLLCYRFYESN
jgi:hypothetical protein